VPAKRKNKTECWCLYGWVCEAHPDQPWEYDGSGAAGELCKYPQCDIDPILISIRPISGTAPEEENRQLEKLTF
jgi:hypothetical protein